MAKDFSSRKKVSIQDFQEKVEEQEPPKKKKEKKGKKQAKPKKKGKIASFYKEKIVSVIVWGFIGLLVVGCITFLLKEVKVSNQLKDLQQQVQKQNEIIKTVNQNTENSGNFDVFNRSFIMKFYNTKDDQQAYQEALKKYFPVDTTIPMNNPAKSNKKVLSIQLWEKKKQDGFYQVKYLIDYQIDEEKGQELFCYNVKEKKGKYLVQTIPYKQVPAVMTNNKIAKATSLPESNEEQIDTKDKTAVNNWLKDTFFPKYIETSDKEVVKYMMKNPEVLGGVMTFKNIQEMDAYPMKGGRIDCYVIVTVTDRELSQDYNNAYHLIINQDDNDQFVIERLTHDTKN
ncbi:hypothetical protein [Enterococcus sp. AZ103]|uniref:hypothetical protein n=1 Tax=Enterococcus sp. AZ103 TaxID=2774628 RepID=UPI003F28720F